MCQFDDAQDLEASYREAAILRALSNPRAVRCMCEHCEENPCEVTQAGLHLRYCTRCKAELRAALDAPKAPPTLRLPAHPQPPQATRRTLARIVGGKIIWSAPADSLVAPALAA